MPPGGGVAASPKAIVQVVNSSVRVWDRSNTLLANTTLALFFGARAPAGGEIFGARVQYDAYAGRFLLLALGWKASTAEASFLLAASKSADATGWYLYRMDARVDGSTVTTNRPDWCAIGFDSQAIYLSANQVRIADPTAFRTAKVRILKRAELYSGKPLTFLDRVGLKDGSGRPAASIVPCRHIGATTEAWMVSARLDGSGVVLWRLADALGSATFARKDVGTAHFDPAPPAVQRGTAVRIDTGDPRIGGAVYLRGVVSLVHSVAANPGGGDPEAAIHWAQLAADLTAPSIRQQGVIAEAGRQFWAPDVAVDRNGKLSFAFCGSSAAQYPSILYTCRAPTDPAGATRSVATLRAGAGYCTRMAADGTVPWNRAAVALDPVDNVSFWVAGPRADTSAANRWLTQLGRLPAP
jgi:hypothetical protein